MVVGIRVDTLSESGLPEEADGPRTEDRTAVDPSGEVRPGARGLTVLRVVGHLTIWTAVAVPAVVEMLRGWRATGDDAVIAIRSWAVLSRNSPLVGEYSSSSHAGHVVHDLGPLGFWLLALPVHIDPAQGLLWGSALCCGVILSLSFEAAWSARAWTVCVLLVLVILDLLWLFPEVFSNLAWNPYSGLMFLVASLPVSWVVIARSLRWWPLLVFTASVTAQAHLFYVAPAVALAIGAPVLGIIRQGRPRPDPTPTRLSWVRRWGWLVWGLVVGSACWLAPLVQQVTGHPGNVSLILGDRHQPSYGLSFGLRQLGLAASPEPIWLRHLPSTLNGLFTLVYSSSVGWGLAVLGTLVMVTIVAWRSGRVPLAALSGVGFLFSLGVVGAYASLPTKNAEIYLGYLSEVTWITSALLWSIALVGLIELARALHRETSGRSSWLQGRRHLVTGHVAAPLVFVTVLVVLVGVGSAVGLHATLGAPPARPDVSRMALDHEAATEIQRQVPNGSVQVNVEPTAPVDMLGVAWELTGDSRRVGLGANYDLSSCRRHPPPLVADACALGLPPDYGAITSGLVPPADHHWPVVSVAAGNTSRSLVVSRVG